MEEKTGMENISKKAMAFIKNEYACGIGVQELAEHLNVNRSYLYTIFMNELHISPKDFCRNTVLQGQENCWCLQNCL